MPANNYHLNKAFLIRTLQMRIFLCSVRRILVFGRGRQAIQLWNERELFFQTENNQQPPFMKPIISSPDKRKLNPADRSDLWYWSEKWGVSIKEVERAIIETGHTDVKSLRKFLMQKNQFNFLVRNCIGTLRSPFRKYTRQRHL